VYIIGQGIKGQQVFGKRYGSFFGLGFTLNLDYLPVFLALPYRRRNRLI
jgi:hypothetical protein